MNTTHIHLLITHLPIIGTGLGAVVLLLAIGRKSNSTLIAAYTVLLLSALGAGIAYATGEGAEESVEHLQGFSEQVIAAHEEFALISLIALIVVGISALAGLAIALKSGAFTRPLALFTLAASLMGFGLAAWTGYLGGKIRHTEIGTKAVSPAMHREE